MTRSTRGSLSLRTRWHQWTPDARRQFLARLDALERERLLELLAPARDPDRFATPGDLAVAIDPATVQTPALDLIDEALVWAYGTPDARLLISLPPQEGKSSAGYEDRYFVGADPQP